MKAAIYARVSSERQDVDLSISAQLKALREYARRNGHSVVKCMFRSKSAGVPEQTGHHSGRNRPPFRSKSATPGMR